MFIKGSIMAGSFSSSQFAYICTIIILNNKYTLILIRNKSLRYKYSAHPYIPTISTLLSTNSVLVQYKARTICTALRNADLVSITH